MLLKTRGVVLHHLKYSESSIISYIYTEEFGRKTFIINNIRGKRSSQKANIFQPLFLLELDVYFKARREIQRIKEFSNIYPFRSVPYDVVKSSIAIFLAEILYKTIKEEEKNIKLFEFLFNTIQMFDITTEGASNFHILFLLHLTRYLGFFPENNYSKQNRFFDLQNGIFTPSIPGHPHYVEPSLCPLLFKALNQNFKDLGSFAIKPGVKPILLDKILEYYRLHIDGLGTIKSYGVLKEVFR